MPTIFISYRRDDSELFAGRIHDKLVPRFGPESIFMDVDAIPLGVDFRQHLSDAVAKCDVLLALISEDWLVISKNGQRRFDDPRDFVRVEIEAALQRDIPVIPVLLGSAVMPGEHELPAALAQLAYRNAIQIDPGRDFHAHMDRLIRGGERLASRSKHEPAQVPTSTLSGKVITNTLGMSFIRVEAGPFWMGSPETDRDADDDEMPRHQVTISRPFFLGIHPVTRGQFAQFVNATSFKTDAETAGGAHLYNGSNWGRDPKANWRDPTFEQSDDHPVVCASWNDAQAFIAWLKQQERREYRLPTEAEWEFSCRAGTMTRFFTGDDADSLVGFANVADLTLKKRFPDCDTVGFEDGYLFTSPVGAFKPNAWGLHDMTGNVWEWCSGWFDVSAYQRGSCQDPQGPTVGSDRVNRGGSWITHPANCRSAYRDRNAPAYCSNCLGFRVVLIG